METEDGSIVGQGELLASCLQGEKCWGRKFYEDLDGEDGKGDVFGLAKWLVEVEVLVVGACCVGDDGGKIVVGGSG